MILIFKQIIFFIQLLLSFSLFAQIGISTNQYEKSQEAMWTERTYFSLKSLNNTSETHMQACSYNIVENYKDANIDSLYNLLSNSDIEIRLNTAIILAKMGEKENCFKTLSGIWNLNNGNKTKCHTGFIIINSKKSINALKMALKDTMINVSLDAAVSLAILNKKRISSKYLLKYISNDDKRIALSALNNLLKYNATKKNINKCMRIIKNSNSNSFISNSKRVINYYKQQL